MGLMMETGRDSCNSRTDSGPLRIHQVVEAEFFAMSCLADRGWVLWRTTLPSPGKKLAF